MSGNYLKLMEVFQTWDTEEYDGAFMPRANFVIVQVPDTLLTKKGGTFTSLQIDSIVRNHMAAGKVPLIHYTSPKPSIISDTQVSSGVVITWPPYKDGTIYDIYVSKTDPIGNPETVWTQVEAGIVQAVGTQVVNELVLTSGIESGITNYVWIKATSGNESTMEQSDDVIRYTEIALS